MATIDMTIVTTYAQIFDSNGVAGFGTVTIRPNQAFEYTSGSTYSITDVSTTLTVENGVFSSPTSVVLAPNKGASNVPETYYIVNINVNGTTQELFWQIDGSSGSATIEFSDVAKLPSANDPNDPLQQILDAANPFGQYVLRSDTADKRTASAASDGRGLIPRAGITNGYLDKSFLFSAITGPDDSAVTGADVPISDVTIIATNAEAALVENRGLINTNTSDIATNITDISDNTTDIGTNTSNIALKLDKAIGSEVIAYSESGSGSTAYNLPSYATRTYFACGLDGVAITDDVAVYFSGNATFAGPRYVNVKNISASGTAGNLRCWYFTP